MPFLLNTQTFSKISFLKGVFLLCIALVRDVSFSAYDSQKHVFVQLSELSAESQRSALEINY